MNKELHKTSETHFECCVFWSETIGGNIGQGGHLILIATDHCCLVL